MARKPYFKTERRNLGALLASFFVILAGLSASIAISVFGSSEDPFIPILISFLFFGLISLIPLSVFRPEQTRAAKLAPRESFWSLVVNLFRSSKEKEKRHTVWKRKKNDYIHQPHGNDYITFVPERPDEPKSQF